MNLYNFNIIAIMMHLGDLNIINGFIGFDRLPQSVLITTISCECFVWFEHQQKNYSVILWHNNCMFNIFYKRVVGGF